MNISLKQWYLVGTLFTLVALQACSQKKDLAPNAVSITDTTQTYFSIKNYIKDQVELLYGQPYSMNQFTTVDGKTDSTMVNFYNMDLGYVLKTFLATDIGNPRFLGKYRFSSFAEHNTGNQTMMYEAIDPGVFTRTLSFNVDPTTNMILSLYIEAAGDKDGTEVHQRLLYVPLKVIQIQEDKSSTFSKMRNFRVEYRFLQ